MYKTGLIAHFILDHTGNICNNLLRTKKIKINCHKQIYDTKYITADPNDFHDSSTEL